MPMTRLLNIMARLRDPKDGCPWDLQQTFDSIAPHTLEEAYEVADAIEQGDMAALKDELGDLLFQVVFYAQIAREAGQFDFSDIVQAISDKMVRRHPHIFGDARIESAEAQTIAWEATKEQERRAKAKDRAPSVLDGVAPALPALTRALKLQKRAGRVGFDWPDAAQVVDKIHEEIAEVQHEIDQGAPHDRLEDEIGDLLFACANLARKLDVDPERALRRGNAKFEQRFHYIERELAKAGRRPEEASLEEMEALWVDAKRSAKDQK